MKIALGSTHQDKERKRARVTGNEERNFFFRISSSLHVYLFLILSLHVCTDCMYTYIIRARALSLSLTHTRSLFMSLSRLYVCVIERGGFPRCVFVCVVIEKEGGEFCVYPGTPGITVSNLSFALSPNEKDPARFKIATSQILC